MRERQDRSGDPPLPRFLLPYARKYAKPFLLAVLFLSAEAFCDLLQPTIMSRVIDEGILANDSAMILRLGGTMLLAAFAGACSAVLRNNISSRVSQRFGADLRSDLYRKVLSFSFDDIDGFETASLVTRLTNDVTQMQNFVNGTMRIFVKAPLLALGGIAMACALDLRMAPILFAVVPVATLLIVGSVRASYPLFGRIQKSLDTVNSFIREYLAGVRVVKAFNRFEHEAVRFEKANRELAGTTTQAMRTLAFFSPCISLAMNLGIAAVLFLGGSMVSSGAAKIGHVVAFVNYMFQILSSLAMIGFIFNMFVRAKASTERIREVMERQSGGAGAALGRDAGIPGEKASPRPSSPQWGIEFKDVWFSYKGDRGNPALRGLSFRCEHGKILGIIGSTGAGKSTLAALVPRFYDADSGSVLVGGVDVRSLVPQALREEIAIVPQTTNLFTGSVLENILWGKEGASLRDAEESAELACARGFILELEGGFDAQVGRGGVYLSGGQRQRIAIARALIRKPKILIVDDGTSAVDAITESRIRLGLGKASEGMTVMFISQRISAIRDSDRILVLEEGEIAGAGSHEELLGSCRTYGELYLSQIGPREASSPRPSPQGKVNKNA